MHRPFRLSLILSCGVLCASQAVSGQKNAAASSRTVTVDAGVPLHVVLDRQVSYSKAGQPLYGHLSQPVYVFDQIAIPAGTTVRGKIASVRGVGKQKRFDAMMGGDFTPLREAEVEFDALVLNDGREIPIRSAGATRDLAVVKMGSGAERGSLWKKLKTTVKTTVETEKRSVEDMVHSPHKVERLKNAMLARMPYHPQVYETGTQFVAELGSPIQVQLPAGVAAPNMDEVGSQPPANSILRARLTSRLSSATNKWGDPVEAVLTAPLYSGEHLVLPEGTRLSGTVLRARPAKRFGHNGELRFTFKEVRLPGGVTRQVRGDLAAAEAGKAANIKIDEEGGAQATQPTARYLAPLALVLLAQSSSESDGDGVNGNAGVAGTGFGLLGRLLSLSAGSRFIAYGVGYYGAGRSIYSRFIARGRDVVFPRDTQLEIKVGKR